MKPSLLLYGIYESNSFYSQSHINIFIEQNSLHNGKWKTITEIQ
jgi:hypothetical protein